MVTTLALKMEDMDSVLYSVNFHIVVAFPKAMILLLFCSVCSKKAYQI